MFKKSLISLALAFSLTACVSTEHTSNVTQINNNSITIAPLTSLYNYQLINSVTKSPISLSTLVSDVKNTDVIFIGEFHSHQGAHLLQLQFLEALYKQNPNLILSMEQFTRDAQPVLDKYLAGEYGEETLMKEGKAWPHYKGSYRAIIEFAREHNIPVIAANSPAMHVRCVGRNGADIIAKFPVEQADWSAKKLDLDNKSYKEKFMSFIRASGRSHGQTPEQQKARQMKTYAAQLLRDTTMAESIIKAMAEHPNAQVVHLNGSFHSDGHLGTVAVLETMKPTLKTKVLSPVMVEDNMKPMAKTDDYAQGDYIYLLREMPSRYIDKEKRNASIRKLIKKRMTEKCEL
ncbi:MAG: hypothetical protein COB35_02600 [Gammaproteobacteria bacterium]|nr:MAG: hypothetical protein COB35_02600 [Gammaproteobacteria bacterium]